VRDDGALLSLTYVPEAGVWGWARHDSEDGDATFLAICTIPEGDEDVVYAAVKRTVGGSAVYYMERFASRQVTDVREGIFLDSTLTFDAADDDGTVTVTAPVLGFAVGATVALASTDINFTTHHVGDWIVCEFDDDPPCRLQITNIANASAATATQLDDLPDDFASGATADAEVARKIWGSTNGLVHLQGKTVGVLGDGVYLGTFTIPAHPNAKLTLTSNALRVVVGLPYDCDFESLELAPGEGRTHIKTVQRVFLEVEASRSFQAGETLADLYRWDADAVTVPDYLTEELEGTTDLAEVRIGNTWNKGGRVVVRHSEPTPLTILSLSREVEFGGV
jgi:hypothetical protein